MNCFYDLRLKEEMHGRVFRLWPHFDICLTRKVLGSWAFMANNVTLGFVWLHLLSLEPL